MRVSNRYWEIVALAGVLTGFALFIGDPLPLVGATGIGLWLLAHQYRFLTRFKGEINNITVTQSSTRDRVIKDQPFVVSVDVSTDRPAELGAKIASNHPVSVTDVPSDESSCELARGEQGANTAFTATGVVAGQLRFEPPDVTLTDPTGLFMETISLGDPLTVEIEAKPPRDLHVGAGGEQLSFGYGEHSSPQLGEGLEPIEVAEYSPGDELRRIDWKATARLGYPHVRKFERKIPRRISLVVDHRESMRAGPPGQRKIDYARDVALLFLNDARTHNDPIGLSAFGDSGVTVAEEIRADLEHYNRLREQIEQLTPTVSTDQTANATRNYQMHTAKARHLADQLSDDESPFASTLRPYVTQRDAYIRRLDSRPLFSTVKAHESTVQQATWTVLITDDTNRAEVHDAVKFARQGDGHVAVFLTPSALFDSETSDDREAAFRRYREFEDFRRILTEMESVTAFEVGPGKRLESLLSARRFGNASTDGDDKPPSQQVEGVN